MNQEHRLLLALLAEELFGVCVPFCAKGTDWRALMTEAKRHSVMPLLLGGLTAHSSEWEVPADLIKQLKSLTVSTMLKGDKLLETEEEILSRLIQSGIPVSVLKGASVAACYPRPELRVLGDIDLLLPEERLEEGAELLREMGFCQSEAAEDHDFHIALEKDGVFVELHRSVSVFPNNDCGNFSKKLFDSALDRTCTAALKGRQFNVLAPKFQLLSLLFHTERHMLTSSVGLRQLCDWAISANYYSKMLTDEDKKDFESCGMWKFGSALCGVCHKHLGMPMPEFFCGTKEELWDRLTEDLLEGSNFFYQSRERRLSSHFVGGASSEDKGRKSAFSAMISRLNTKAYNRYPITKKCPILLPVFWIYIPFLSLMRILFKKQEADIGQVMKSAKKRNRLYDDLKLFEKK